MYAGNRRFGGRGLVAARFAAAALVIGVASALAITVLPATAVTRTETPSDKAAASTHDLVTNNRIAVFGDSLTVQATRELVALGAAHGLAVQVSAYYGLAPCDLASLAREAVARRPAALVLAFSGNNLTPCMTRGGARLTGAAYYAAYGHDVGALVAYASAHRVHVVLVEPPTFPGDLDVPHRAPLDAVYADLARRYRETLVTTAGALGGNAFTTSLPCAAGETAALGCHGGRVTARNASRIHFDDPRPVPCPDGAGACEYSAGARRYAAAILTGLAKLPGLRYEPAPPTAGMPVRVAASKRWR